MSKTTTLRAIGKHAEVALSTVSQVLNNKPGANAQTRKRVHSSAEKLDYQPTLRLDSGGGAIQGCRATDQTRQ